MVRATPRVRRASATSSGRSLPLCSAFEQASERGLASSSSGHSPSMQARYVCSAFGADR